MKTESTPLRSLSGLIDFEAAARWSSIKLAAYELHKTPGAVSQQIKQLEMSLGFALFTRQTRQIKLTDKGQELALTVRGLLEVLHGKVAALRGGDEEWVLRISATHSFATKWLVPRLHRFTKLQPKYDLHVESSDQLTPLASSTDQACDIAIHYSRGALDAAPRLAEQWVVVYSPAVLPYTPSKQAVPVSIDTLDKFPLLYEGTTENWLLLLKKYKAVATLKGKHNFSRAFSHSGTLVQAAVAAQGVALAPYSIAHEDIVRGNLRVIPELFLPSPYAYHLRVGAGKHALQKVGHFSAWMQQEWQGMAATHEGMALAHGV
ncbi:MULTISPECIES: LysR substrate-binding domain-containing protein [Rugamonas]|uniref:LysR family transcriptional regulator, glycine cleavage system transcriptional activator n=1 Tax=Rugamonas rubra TaxID=758825 RepID=A0A1I4SFF9_9BURK|nr:MULTISPECIES: LysR substrate-binding domain-containing protein [Rugamonas]WGG52612.1 LysR substrate-binding domain-containing protein [Rugamonas sp. DEMB1]SFM63033.1 LysR family transcriptional regulator, glycine cleavage system transcriptional activator [Rugamonas rubra]